MGPTARERLEGPAEEELRESSVPASVGLYSGLVDLRQLLASITSNQDELEQEQSTGGLPNISHV